MVFLDKKGNERQISFTLRSFFKVKEYYGIDMVSNEFSDKLVKRPDMLFEIVWLLCRIGNESYEDFLKKLNKKVTQYIVEQFIHCLRESFEVSFKSKEKDNGPSKGLKLRDFVEMAGSCGCTCYMDMTPGELIDFKIAYDRNQWNLQSVLLAIINNTHCFKQSDVKKPEDFNPFCKTLEPEIECDFFDLLVETQNGKQ